MALTSNNKEKTNQVYVYDQNVFTLHGVYQVYHAQIPTFFASQPAHPSFEQALEIR